MSQDESQDPPVIIKKYANRRLYNTESSSYVTLDHLAEMVKEGRDFAVKDAKTGEDITRSVLTQIIFEQEGKGETLLPIPFLRQLISFYGHGLQSMVPTYLQSSMEAFTRNQEQFREMVGNTMNPGQAFAAFDELTRKNMAMFESAVQMFSPFAAQSKETPAQTKPQDDDSIAELKRQMDAIQAKLDKLSKG